MSIEDKRKIIDEVDEKLIELLEKRMRAVEEIAEYKKEKLAAMQGK